MMQILQQDPAVLSACQGLSFTSCATPNRQPGCGSVDVGSVNRRNQLGLAHFTEHMAFNGTKNFAKNEVVEYLPHGMGYYNGLTP